MACFVIPAAEAAVTTIVTKVLELRERKMDKGKDEKVSSQNLDVDIRFSSKLKWLSNLLWGGSAMLAFEHLWHGEITPFYPFLTAVNTPESTQEMFREMATNGVGMAAVVTIAWGVMIVVSHMVRKRSQAKDIQTVHSE